MSAILIYVEIDLPRCIHDYGLSPCSAAIGVTGSDRCYKVLSSCQDTEAFSAETYTIRFGLDVPWAPRSIPAIPAIRSESDISYAPGMISLGKDIGQRTRFSVALRDMKHSDVGIDPYWDLRAYNAYERGTLFGKLRARHPYLRGLKLRYILGRVGQTLEEMETHHLIVEGYDGPTIDGVYTVTAQDLLKSLNGKRALAPAPSNGSLSAGISSSATSLALTPSGIGNAEYPASDFYVAVGGKEILHCSTRSGDTLNIDGRAQRGSPAAVAHSSGDRVQLCLIYDGKTASYIISDLEQGYGGFDAAYIPQEAWDAEIANYLPSVYTTTIAEPEPVEKLVAELIEQAALAHWWDDTVPELKLQVLRGIPTSAATFSLEESTEGFRLGLKDQPEKRITRVWTRFGRIDPLRPLDELANYRSSSLTVSPSEDGQGTTVTKIINSRWIPEGGKAIADRLNDIILSRYGMNGPRAVTFSIDRSNDIVPAWGGGYQISVPPNQDVSGAALALQIQVTRIRPLPDRFDVWAEEMLFNQVGEIVPGLCIIDSSINDINLRTLHDSLYSPATAGDEVQMIIEASATVGATSTAVPALTIGDWPKDETTGNTTASNAVITNLPDTSTYTEGMFVRGTGIPNGAKIATVDSSSQVTLDTNCTANGTGVAITVYTIIINVEIKGRVQGKGGAAGAGGGPLGSAGGAAGSAGGPALYTRYPINLTSTDGEIHGGGGGGGGGGGARETPGGPIYGGGGGGGGAGTQAGAGAAGYPGAVPGASGSSGTSEAGGSAGAGGAPYGGSGGNGGAAGSAGSNGSNGSGGLGGTGGSGGAAGAAIDGDSYILDDGTPGDIQGSQVN